MVPDFPRTGHLKIAEKPSTNASAARMIACCGQKA
jgi:hypothetical protein